MDSDKIIRKCVRLSILVTVFMIIVLLSLTGPNYVVLARPIPNQNDDRVSVFESLISELESDGLNESQKSDLIDQFMIEQTNFGFPIIGDEVVYIIYRGLIS